MQTYVLNVDIERERNKSFLHRFSFFFFPGGGGAVVHLSVAVLLITGLTSHGVYKL